MLCTKDDNNPKFVAGSDHKQIMLFGYTMYGLRVLQSMLMQHLLRL